MTMNVLKSRDSRKDVFVRPSLNRFKGVVEDVVDAVPLKAKIAVTAAIAAYAVYKFRKSRQENNEDEGSFPVPKEMKSMESPSKKSVPMTETLLSLFREFSATIYEDEPIGV